MPIIHHHIAELRAAVKPYRSQQRIALVPTMGNLHDGHLELVKLAKQYADIVIVSLFVNPTQFGIGEDFDSYPRTFDDDVAKLATVNADYIFAPSVDEMYPVLPSPTSIHAGAITVQLCGQSRPSHFDGVGIVVSKLFNIVQPDVAIFGQKDYQQLAIIKQLVRDLSYPIDIVVAPIIRASDGLALSSRNRYLNDSERQAAPILHRELQNLAQQLIDNKHSGQGLETLLAKSCARITAVGFNIDYLEVKTAQLESILNSEAKKPQAKKSQAKVQELIIVAAVWLGRARLLDNQLVTINQ